MSRTSTVRHALVRSLGALCALWLAQAGLCWGQATNIVPTPGALGTGGLGTSVTSSGNTVNITGGTQPGNGPNLFHSFNQFSVGPGNTAAFVNPGGVSNIISRVIGGSPSNINGTIQALNANLFFINPSGVIFGPNASLNVTGSAYFSSAHIVQFSDQRVFTTSSFAFDNTLSTATPISFGFLGSGPYGPVALSPGASLQSNAVIGLIGGTVQIDGGRITAQRIVLASNAAAGGNVSVEPTVSNPFARISQGGQIQVSSGTLLQAGGGGVIPASIDLFPGNLTVPSGAQANTTVNPVTQQITQISVVGQAGGLPPLPVASATTAAPVVLSNPIDPVLYLNRAAIVMPVQSPAAPVALVTSRCASRKDGEFSTFVQSGRDATPAEPGGTLASPVMLEPIGVSAQAAPVHPRIVRVPQPAQGQAVETWQGC